MSDIVTHQDADDADATEKPPPCPWCHASGVREITVGSGDTRWFFCESCKRVFSIRCELLKPPEKKD
jgi:transposase-like protein